MASTAAKPTPTPKPQPMATFAPEPATPPAAAPAIAPPTPPASLTELGVGIAPTMQGSLPPIAAGSDLYARQFYGGSPQPRRRFLPVGLRP